MSSGKVSPARKPMIIKTMNLRGQPLCSGYQNVKQLTKKLKKKYIRVAINAATIKATKYHGLLGKINGGLITRKIITISGIKKAKFRALSAMSRANQFFK